MTRVSETDSEHYWRTVRRKLGESLDPSGKASKPARGRRSSPPARKAELRFLSHRVYRTWQTGA